MNEKMPEYTPEDVEEFKKQLKKERGRKVVGKMTEEEISSRREEINADLKKEVDPVTMEKIEKSSVDNRIKRNYEEELPIFGTTEKKELSLEQKKIKLEKLESYLEDLKQGEAPSIVKDKKGVMKEEITKVEAEIKKIEEELER